MNLNTLKIPSIGFDTVNRPGDCIAENLSKYRHTGLAYGRQVFLCPLTRTALPQLVHQNAMRQEDHIHMAGLAKAAPELTVAHAPLYKDKNCTLHRREVKEAALWPRLEIELQKW